MNSSNKPNKKRSAASIGSNTLNPSEQANIIDVSQDADDEKREMYVPISQLNFATRAFPVLSYQAVSNQVVSNNDMAMEHIPHSTPDLETQIRNLRVALQQTSYELNAANEIITVKDAKLATNRALQVRHQRQIANMRYSRSLELPEFQNAQTQLQNEILSLRDNNILLQTQITTLTTELTSKSSNEATLQSQITALEIIKRNNEAALQNQIMTLENDKRYLENQISYGTDNVINLQAQLKLLKNNLGTQTIIDRYSKDTITTLSNNLLAKSRENITLHQKNEDFQTQLTNKNAEIIRLKEALQNRSTDVIAENNSLTIELAAKILVIRDLEAQLANQPNIVRPLATVSVTNNNYTNSNVFFPTQQNGNNQQIQSTPGSAFKRPKRQANP